MKKIFVSAALIAATASVSAQEISLNKRDGDTHRIHTTATRVQPFKSRIMVEVSMSKVTTPKGTTKSIRLTIESALPLSIGKGDEFIFEDMNGQKYTFINPLNQKDRIGFVVEIGNYINTHYRVHAILPVDDTTLAALCGGVKSLTFEIDEPSITTGVAEMRYKKDKIGKVLRKCNELIDSAEEPRSVVIE